MLFLEQIHGSVLLRDVETGYLHLVDESVAMKLPIHNFFYQPINLLETNDDGYPRKQRGDQQDNRRFVGRNIRRDDEGEGEGEGIQGPSTMGA